MNQTTHYFPMKTPFKALVKKTSAIWGGTLLVLALTLSSPMAIAANTAANREDKGFLEKMEGWQEKMSEKFRDTWKNLRGDDQKKSVSTASVDLREDSDNYTIRLNLPERDLEKVEINLERDTVRILAPAGEKAGRYEQTIALMSVAPGAQPKIDRRPEDKLIVVTIPKDATKAKKESSPALTDPSLLPLTDWDRDVFARMEKMRRDMDRIFDESFSALGADTKRKGFFDEPRFGSSLDLKDEGDKYVVRAYLPDRDMQHVNVTVENQVLRIQASEQESSEDKSEPGKMRSTRKAAFSQMLTLPGPVDVQKMDIQKKEGMLVVTLPKAK